MGAQHAQRSMPHAAEGHLCEGQASAQEGHSNFSEHSMAARSGFRPNMSAAEALHEARARSSAARTPAQPRHLTVAEAEQELAKVCLHSVFDALESAHIIEQQLLQCKGFVHTSGDYP